jgi:hypothetical protein
MWSPVPVIVEARAMAARFSVNISPTPVVDQRGQNVRLEWSRVTVTSDEPVRWRVLRHAPNSPSVEVCLGADAPIVSDSIVTCTDRKPGNNPSYSIEAYVVDHTGARTWSLPPSPLVSA